MSDADNLIVNLNNTPPIKEMLEELVAPVRVSGDTYSIRTLNKMSRYKFWTTFAYVRLALIYEMFVVRKMYDANDDSFYIKNRMFFARNCGFVYKNIRITPTLGLSKVYIDDQEITQIETTEVSVIVMSLLIDMIPALMKLVENKKEKE